MYIDIWIVPGDLYHIIVNLAFIRNVSISSWLGIPKKWNCLSFPLVQSAILVSGKCIGGNCKKQSEEISRYFES